MLKYNTLPAIIGTKTPSYLGNWGSDRPTWAGTQGNEGKPGRGTEVVSGTMKGTLYGDMYVLLRDENGVPILSPEGLCYCVRLGI